MLYQFERAFYDKNIELLSQNLSNGEVQDDDAKGVEMEVDLIVSAGQATCAEVTYANEVTQFPMVSNYGHLRRPFTGFGRIMNIFELEHE
jgi:hypothetical protein